MFFTIKTRKDLENLEALASLENQVEQLHVLEKLGKQVFHKKMKKLHEPLTDTLRKTSEMSTATLTETSNNNNKALENINEKV